MFRTTQQRWWMLGESQHGTAVAFNTTCSSPRGIPWRPGRAALKIVGRSQRQQVARLVSLVIGPAETSARLPFGDVNRNRTAQRRRHSDRPAFDPMLGSLRGHRPSPRLAKPANRVALIENRSFRSGVDLVLAAERLLPGQGLTPAEGPRPWTPTTVHTR